MNYDMLANNIWVKERNRLNLEYFIVDFEDMKWDKQVQLSDKSINLMK